MVIFDGSTTHWSFTNTSDKPRPAYIMHLVESENVEWGEGWNQRPKPGSTNTKIPPFVCMY